MVDKVTDLATQMIASDRPELSIAAHNVYELPSTKRVVRFLHAALGFATKEWKLCHVSQPHDENVTKCFSESNETQKGHKRQQCQGVR